MPETSLPVEYLFTMSASTTAPAVIPGRRIIVGVGEGSFQGPRLRGRVDGPAGDWLELRPSGFPRLDVRLTLVTDDDALIYMTYRGVIDFEGGRIRTAPLFDTSDDRYAWLNDVQAVGLGEPTSRQDGTGVSYDVYALA